MSEAHHLVRKGWLPEGGRDFSRRIGRRCRFGPPPFDASVEEAFTAPRTQNPENPEERGASAMRFMMFMIPNFSDDDWMPPVEAVEAMTKYNEELTKAGVLLALDGLHPSSAGVRVSFPGGKPTVTDGPFAEAKEVIGGYWLIDVESKEEAIEWAKRVPVAEGPVIEVRQIFEMEDFPSELRQAAGR
jgi:hypothetical protein